MKRKKISFDVLRIILDYSDQRSLYELGLTNRQISRHALCKLWSDPIITNVNILHLFINTLRLENTLYPYNTWTRSLSLHMINKDQYYTCLSDSLFDTMLLLSLSLRSISLQHIDITSLSSIASFPHFEAFISKQLDQGVEELHAHQCAPTVINSLSQAIQKETRIHLKELCFFECEIFDYHIERVTMFTPNLVTLKLDQCCCFSDDGLIPVAKHCQGLRTLLVTLPSTIVQSNTITVKTLIALQTYCSVLKLFVCSSGQVRIMEQSNEKNMFSFKIIIVDSGFI